MPSEVLVETLRERRRSLLWWTVGLTVLIALNIAFYPSVRDSAGLADYGKDLPESLRALFVGGELDLVSAAGYLNSQVFALMAPALAAIFAISAGASAVAGEEERGTLEVLLAQPLRRRDYVIQRFLALAVLVAALTIVLFGTVALGSRLVDLEIGFGNLLAASVSVGLVALLFGAAALSAGAIRPGRPTAIAAGGGIAVAAWVLDGLGRAVEALDPWRPLSPLYQAIGRDPLRTGVPWEGWAILAAATALLVLLAVLGFQRRDVRA